MCRDVSGGTEHACQVALVHLQKDKYRPELHQYAAWRNPSALTHTNIPHTCTGGAGKLNHMDYDVVKRTVKDFEMGLWEEKDWGRACFEI